MSTPDFFRVLLKIAGLFVLLSVFAVLPSLANFFSYEADWSTYTSVLFVPTALLSIFALLVFYPDLIITKLKLDKGLDASHIPFDKLDAYMILQLAMIIVGGMIFVENISPFLSTGYYLLKASVPGAMERHFMGFDAFAYKIQFGTNIFNLVIGYLMITNCQHLSKVILGKNKTTMKSAEG